MLVVVLTLSFPLDAQAERLPDHLGPRGPEIKARAERGDATAQTLLASAYLSSLDSTNAVMWYQRAAKKGNADAYAGLGNIYIRGWTPIPPQPAEAMRCYKLAANQGQILGLGKMAEAYERGRYVKTNYVESLKYYILASEKGSSKATEAVERLTANMSKEDVADAKRRAKAFVPVPPPLPVLTLETVTFNGDKPTATINGKSLALREPTLVPIDGELIEVTFLGVTNKLAAVSVIGEKTPRVLKVK